VLAAAVPAGATPLASGTWGKAEELPGITALSAGNGGQSDTMACASAGNCSGGGFYQDSTGQQGFVVDERDGTWGSAEQVPGLEALNTAGNASLGSVACASAGDCSAGGTYSTAATDGLQGFVVSEKNGVWGKAKELPGLGALNTGGEANLVGVSCASAGNCALGGAYYTVGGQFEAFVATEKNGTWGSAREVPGTAQLNVGGSAGVMSLSCASAGNCSAGGTYTDGSGQSRAFVVEETKGTWGHATQVPGLAALNKGGAYVSSVSCSSAGNCGAVGNYTDSSGGQMFVVNETGGTWGDAEEIPGTAGLNMGDGFASGVSCGSTGNCGATGWYGLANGDSAAFVVSESGGIWGDAEPVPGLAAFAPDGSNGEIVSCASANHCSASGIASSPGTSDPYVVGEK
jgi:hypothetical protein